MSVMTDKPSKTMEGPPDPSRHHERSINRLKRQAKRLRGADSPCQMPSVLGVAP